MAQDNPTSTPDADRAKKRAAEQNAQARLVLIQLLWVAVLLMVAAMVYLAHNQKKLATRTEERLAVVDTFTTRLNNMDDRLFALAPSERKAAQSDNAQSDARLVFAQLLSADRLYQAGDYSACLEVLKWVQAQLQSDRLVLASPLAASLKTATAEDIVQVRAVHSQIDPWQESALKIRQAQDFLHTLEGAAQTTPTRDDLLLHKTETRLMVAQSAASVRERETLVVSLDDAIKSLRRLKNSPQFQDLAQKDNQSADAKAEGIASWDDAIFALNEILANPPKLTPLKSAQIARSVDF